MRGLIAMLYGIACYVVFLVVILYSIGFVGNLYVPKSIDVGNSAAWSIALITNVFVLSLFAIHHSVMARPAAKQILTRIIPASVERSTYVLISSLLLALIFWLWVPMPEPIWKIENPIAVTMVLAIFWLGWAMVFLATFMIDHFDLLGLRQVYLRLTGKEYTAIELKTPMLYKYMRHPIMSGFIIAFWATPHMTQGHLLFAIITTGYILVGLYFEERDLINYYGEQYESYKQQVAMLFPNPFGK